MDEEWTAAHAPRQSVAGQQVADRVIKPVLVHGQHRSRPQRPRYCTNALSHGEWRGTQQPAAAPTDDRKIPPRPAQRRFDLRERLLVFIQPCGEFGQVFSPPRTGHRFAELFSELLNVSFVFRPPLEPREFLHRQHPRPLDRRPRDSQLLVEAFQLRIAEVFAAADLNEQCNRIVRRSDAAAEPGVQCARVINRAVFADRNQEIRCLFRDADSRCRLARFADVSPTTLRLIRASGGCSRQHKRNRE